MLEMHSLPPNRLINMTLCLLDRNVVIDIEKHFNNPAINVQTAKKVDRADNVISPLLSIIEGSGGKPMNIQECHDLLNKEARLVRKFYKKAKTDADYLIQNSISVVELLRNENIEKFEIQKNFIIEAQEKYADDIAPAKLRPAIFETIETAKNCQIQISDIIVLITIATICQNRVAKKVLKPKKNIDQDAKEAHAYNAFMDIAKLKSHAYIKSLAKSPMYTTKFITDDKNLLGLANQLLITARASQVFLDKQYTAYSLTLRNGFFGQLYENTKLFDEIIGIFLKQEVTSEIIILPKIAPSKLI